MAIHFEYFFLIKRQNGECNVRNFRRILFGTSHDLTAFEVRVFTGDLRFWIVVNILTHILRTLLTFILPNFAKSINFSWLVSLWCELLYKRSIYTLKTDKWITIWWAKFELKCLLLIFIYFNSKFKVTCKNSDFECRYIRTHSDVNF